MVNAKIKNNPTQSQIKNQFKISYLLCFEKSINMEINELIYHFHIKLKGLLIFVTKTEKVKVKRNEMKNCVQRRVRKKKHFSKTYKKSSEGALAIP